MVKNKHDIDARCSETSDYFDAGFAPQNILAKFVGTHANGRKKSDFGKTKSHPKSNVF